MIFIYIFLLFLLKVLYLCFLLKAKINSLFTMQKKKLSKDIKRILKPIFLVKALKHVPPSCIRVKCLVQLESFDKFEPENNYFKCEWPCLNLSEPTTLWSMVFTEPVKRALCASDAPGYDENDSTSVIWDQWHTNRDFSCSVQEITVTSASI